MLCGARWYDPYGGRWLSRDPIGYEGGVNLYEYCDGNPVGALDPSGTIDVIDFIPFVGSGRDLYRGIRDGDWCQAVLGVGGLAIDIATFGGDSVIVGAAKSCGKVVAEAAAKAGARLAAKAESRAGAFIAKRLAGHVARTVSHGVELTIAQSKAAKRWRGLYRAFLGERIDYAVRNLVRDDWLLKRLVKETPRGQAGPDFVARYWSEWWDVTTQKQVGAHMTRYGSYGKGTCVLWDSRQ